jgi:rhamnogalacturonan endolyase
MMNARSLLSSAILCLATLAASQLAAANPSGSLQWEKDIRAFEAADRANPPPDNAILFVGSSTIRFWKTLAQDFPEYKVLNRGFGGCQIADCTYYAARIVIPYKPRLIVLRAGGNDIQAGKTPEQVEADFRAFADKVRAKLPEVRIAYMTINATPSRWANIEREKKANLLIKEFMAKGKNFDYIDTFDDTMGQDGKPRPELFVKDRLHFNAEGYKILASRVRKHLGKLTTFPDVAPVKVTVTDDGREYSLANADVTARISKRSGDLLSLKYRGLELLGTGSGHACGYWSHAASGGSRVVAAVTIDPASNGGQRGEVSVKETSRGAALGRGPGGSTVCDVEIRYCLGRGDSGLYTYSIFEHKQDYTATSIGEARFATKLNSQVFDWMTIDANRNKLMPCPQDWDGGTQLNMKEARRLNSGLYAGQVEHKYDYSAVQFEIPAYGWCGTKRHIGLWFVNPTIEYLSGGATKVELTGHLDNNAGAAATLLNYWRGSHYGGSRCEIASGEAWTKVIGPFLIYCNSAATPHAMWQDALAQAKKEAAAWPYDWVSGVDYPHRDGRGTVSGRIELNDPPGPLGPGTKMSHLLVGLAHPDYRPRDESVGGGRRARGAGPVDWQRDAKYYEFWVRGDEKGRFSIPNVRPGIYTLHAIADGVLGEYAKTGVKVEAGKSVDLGRLEWLPVRWGQQVWEIGIPDRTAAEFFHGDHYWQWGLYNDYPKDFPNDVNFVIGKSDYRKDWNYCQCPRADRPNGTTWSITFNLAYPPHGKATLRLALAATSARNIVVTANDRPAGETGRLEDTAAIRRDGIRGYWTERAVSFDGSLLKAGENVIKLTIPPGNAMGGVEYDYLRLEVDYVGSTAVP